MTLGAGVVGIAGQAAYTATKHGVVGLTKSAALDYARSGVRIRPASTASAQGMTIAMA